MLRSSLNDSTTAMSHHSCVRWPKTTPMVLHIRGALPPRNETVRPAISPDVGTRMPVSILMVVDLPAPFGPM